MSVVKTNKERLEAFILPWTKQDLICYLQCTISQLAILAKVYQVIRNNFLPDMTLSLCLLQNCPRSFLGCLPVCCHTHSR